MHVVMFSMTPLFATKSMGGAQKQLKKIALGLAQAGHRVTILCTRRDPDALQAFQWHTDVVVVPTLRFKQPFPEPYDTAIYHIANAMHDAIAYIRQADAFYSHDGGLIFPIVHRHKPSLVSLRSVLFSETLLSGLLFDADGLIVPSQHSANVWLATTGAFYPQLSQRLHVIHNGLDFSLYHASVETSVLVERLHLDPARFRYLLYPHRPEDGKGIRQTIALMDMLVHQYGLQDVRVLVPRWIDTGLAPHVRAYYDSLAADIAARGLTDYFVFHDWIGDDDMPAYFNIGSVTLVLGSYVETFGNTPYESLACGTPPVVAQVGAYRGQIPESYLVDYNDIASAAAKVLTFLTDGDAHAQSSQDWLHAHYTLAAMTDAYTTRILTQPQLAPLEYVYREPVGYRLAPWCYLRADGSLYNDFTAQTLPQSALPEALNTALLLRDDPSVDAGRHDGWLVPAYQ